MGSIPAGYCTRIILIEGSFPWLIHSYNVGFDILNIAHTSLAFSLKVLHTQDSGSFPYLLAQNLNPILSICSFRSYF